MSIGRLANFGGDLPPATGDHDPAACLDPNCPVLIPHPPLVDMGLSLT